MKFSEQWLREWVNPAVTTTVLAEQLTMAGLEVDAIEPVASTFNGVVVGRVLSIKPHPQADRLQVCGVDVGADEPLSIVCGARNVTLGMRVPTACIGASLPNGVRIKKTRLRGVESQGMLCSAAELGLAESAEGLLPLDDDAEPGRDVRGYLGLDDVSIELGLTPNRSDCLSIAGVAREVAVLNECPLSGPPIAAVNATTTSTFPVSVVNTEACPRYLGRVIEGVDNSSTSPLWLRERLRRSGIRTINPVVDVTNYVMLELGQPMHAFDRQSLEGGIVVRSARTGESLTLLDEQQVTLNDETLIIADERQPLAMAGVMGGLSSAVTQETTTLFLESAFFSPAAITGKARAYGLHTDSSHRFERGVDPELPHKAIERATQLLLDIVGGQAGPVIEAADTDRLPRPARVPLRRQRLRRLLGMTVDDSEVERILKALGMVDIVSDEQGWIITPPPFRFDIAIEADLIEEIARVHGYNRLPVSQPLTHTQISATTTGHGNVERQVRDVMIRREYQEAICYSFVSEDLQRLFDPEYPGVRLANPLSAELAVMRTSLWPGLIQALQYNLNRQHKRVRLFEVGVRFLLQGGGKDADIIADKIREENIVAGIACGDRHVEQWGVDSRAVDFFDIKADIEVLLGLTGCGETFHFEAAGNPVLHPGQSACILSVDGTVIGWCGLLHPSIQASLGLDRDVFLFELPVNVLHRNNVAQFRALSRFPVIRRDLAIVVDRAIPAARIQAAIAEVAGDLLRETIIFDVYTGKGVDSDAKSLAIGLTLQEFSRTLTDDEVEALVGRVLSHLEVTFGATLRE